MKQYELDKEEQAILRAFERGKLKSIPNVKREIKRYQQYARAMVDKKRNINIRISEADLFKLKSRAIEKGLPYQTLVTSVLHQYSTGALLEREQRVSSARR
jgi:predicted DNA binding CopG/RHH family protein